MSQMLNVSQMWFLNTAFGMEMQETSAASAAKAADGLPASKASLEEHQRKEAPWSFHSRKVMLGFMRFQRMEIASCLLHKCINIFLRRSSLWVGSN